MFSRSLVTVFGALLFASLPACAESIEQLEADARSNASSPIDTPHPMAMARGRGPKIQPCLRVGGKELVARRAAEAAAKKAAEKK